MTPNDPQRETRGPGDFVGGLLVAGGLQAGEAAAIQGEGVSSGSEFQAVEPHSAMDAVVQRAMLVIGNKQEALRWLGSPVRALEYATPVSKLSSPAGVEEVLTALDNLEHGVF